MTATAYDLLASGERRRVSALLGGRPVGGATAPELAVVARHVIDHPAYDGSDGPAATLRELRGAHPAAWRTFGPDVLTAAATRVEAPGCRWDLLRARLRVARKDEPRRSRALDLLLGPPCPSCASRLDARDADARILAHHMRPRSAPDGRAGPSAARGGGRAPGAGPGACPSRDEVTRLVLERGALVAAARLGLSLDRLRDEYGVRVPPAVPSTHGSRPAAPARPAPSRPAARTRATPARAGNPGRVDRMYLLEGDRVREYADDGTGLRATGVTHPVGASR